MDAQHYKSFDYAINTFHHSRDIFVQTEFLHALYDGGAGAGLDDFWQQMKTTQNSGGGFIWAFLDEGIVRRDLNDSIRLCWGKCTRWHCWTIPRKRS